MKSLNKICTLLGLGLLCAIVPLQAQALTASPIKVELNTDPGKTTTSQFKLYNEGKTTETFYILAQNFEAKGEDGTPTLVSGTDGLAGWIEPINSVTIGPKEYKTIPLAITVPKSAEPGGYFAAILSSTVPPVSKGNQNVLLEGQVGTLVLLQVNGDFQQGAHILEFGTSSKSSWFTSLPVEFYYRFQNAGASYEKPIGDLQIKNIFGGTTKTIPTNSDRGNVLPKSIRRFTTTWFGAEENGKFPKGFFNQVRYEWNNFALGRYTANLNLIYGNSTDQTAFAHTAVWIFPWQLILTVLVTAIVVFGLSISIAALIILRILKKRRK